MAGAGILLASLLGTASVSAQSGTVKGIVTDEAGLPLPGVNVILEGTTVGAATDLQGSFEIAGVPAGTYVIRASAIGFHSARETVVIRSGSSVSIRFVLRERVLEASEVVVTASRREQPSYTVPVSVSVMSARDLAVRNVVKLDDALRYISGVHIQDNQVNVRGSSGFAYNTGSRVLMLLDGMQLLTPDSDGIPFDALPFAQIERVEVLKGPGSALYGSGALGGVINVITRDFPETPESLIRAYAGGYEPVRYQLWKENWKGSRNIRAFGGLTYSHARKTSERFGFWVDLSYRRDQGYTSFGEQRVFNGYGKLGWKPKPQYRVDMLVGLMLREKDNFLFWNSARDALNPGSLDIGDASGPADTTRPPTGTSDTVNNQVSLLPSFKHLVSDRLFYTVRGRLFGAIIRPIDNVTGKPRSIKDGGIGFRYGAEAVIDWEPETGRHFSFGATGDANATRNDFFVSGDGDDFGSQPETAVFGHWEESLTDRLQIVAGLRFDAYRIDSKNIETKLSPKISAAYSLTHSVALRAAFGDGFRVPSFAERFTDNREFFPIVRNLGLKPERSRSYEIGLRTRTNSGRFGAFSSDVAFFLNEYWELIEPKLVPSLQAFQFINLTRARIRGMEATLEWTLPVRDISFRIGYTLLDADDLTEDVPLAFRAKHLLVSSVDARVWGPIEAGMDFRFVTRPERLDTDFTLFVTDADILVDTKVVDIRVAAAWNNLRVAILLKNALEYYYLERPALLGAPRNLLLQLQYGF